MANTEIRRTSGSTPTNAEKFTISLWFKKSKNSQSSERGLLGWRENINSGNNSLQVEFQTTDKFQVQFLSNNGNNTHINLVTNRQLRDNSSWYHLVIAVDSSQTTASDRAKIYFNGVQETSLSSSTYPASGRTFFSSDVQINFGKSRGTTNNDRFFNGAMSHIHFIDGTAYDASAFGETDATTGEWKIKTSPSVTYGNNGFFILKDGNSVTDQSGKNNNFSVGGGALTNTKDCPSNVFATLNPLQKLGNSNVTLNYGNTAYKTTSSAWGNITSTLGFSSGKFYVEGKILGLNSSTGYGGMGIIDSTRAGITTGNESFIETGNTAGMALDYRSGQSAIKSGGSTVSSNIGNFSNGDIIGMAIDMDNKALYIHKGGTYYQIGGVTGVPTSGASKTGAITIPTSIETCAIGMGGYSGNADFCYNFGNGYFISTAVASAGTNASGNGIFEYDVPTGFTAISTKGLNL